MKQITKNTILKQGDKTYQPVEVDGIIYWVDEKPIGSISQFIKVAQSQPGLEGIPVISLDSYVEKLASAETNSDEEKHVKKHNSKHFIEYTLPIHYSQEPKNKDILAKRIYLNRSSDFTRGFGKGYKSNPNQYTQKDIEKAIELAQKMGYGDSAEFPQPEYTEQEILDQINSISVIEVDGQFNIISYE